MLFLILFLFPCFIGAAASEQSKTTTPKATSAMVIKAKTPIPSGTPSSYAPSMLSQSVPCSPKALQRPLDPTFKVILEVTQRKVSKPKPAWEDDEDLFEMDE